MLQEAPADDKTTMETVISADWRRTKLMAERDKIEKMTDEERDEHAERLNEIYEELHDIGADSAEARASAILSGLQVKPCAPLRRSMCCALRCRAVPRWSHYWHDHRYRGYCN